MALGFGFDLMSQATRQRPWTPRYLFGNGEQGAWYDPSDFATLYQDSAGTTPVTQLGQPVGLMLDKANWDGRGVVNLLDRTEEFDQSPWSANAVGTASAPAVTANDAIAPDGSITADKVVFDRGAGNTTGDHSWLNQDATVLDAEDHEGSIWLKAATPSDVGKEIAFRVAPVGSGGYEVHVLTAEWQRVAQTATTSSTTAPFQIANRGTITADSVVTVHLWGAQLERGTSATQYQRNDAIVGGAGNHASQSTSTARPTVQARVNLLERTEPDSTSPTGWTSLLAGGTRTLVTNAEGQSAINFSVSAAREILSQSVTLLPNTTYTLSAYFEDAVANPGIVLEARGFVGASGTVQLLGDPLSDGRHSITFTTSTDVVGDIYFGAGTSSNATGSITISGLQLEVGTSATTYQRVTTATDYEDIGLPRYLEFDGVDDYMAMSDKSALNGADAAAIIYGARATELPPTFTRVVLQYSTSSNAAVTRATTYYSATDRGVGGRNDDAGSFYGDAISGSDLDPYVGSGLIRFSSQEVEMRINGATDGPTAMGSTLPPPNTDSLEANIATPTASSSKAAINLYQLILRNADISGALLDVTEAYIAHKTGVTL